MPVTPDRPDAGDQPSSADEARETVPLDPGERPAVRVGVRPAAPDRETVSLSRETVHLGRPGDRPGDHGDRPAGDRPSGDGPGGDRPDERETVVVPRQREQGGRAGGRAPVVVAAAFATLWAALLSWLPVTAVMGLAQLAEDTGSPLGAARAGLAGWLLGHGVPLTTALGPLGIAPLLLTALIAWRLVRAGVHVTRAVGARRSGRVRDAALVAVAVGAGYGLLGALAALLARTAGLGVPVPRAAVTLAGFGAVFGFAGALRGTHAVRALARRTHPVVRHGLRTGAVAALLLVAAGAATLGLSTALGGGQAADLIGAYRTGVAGQAGITLVSLAFAPNAAVWATAYLLGPGFAVGAGTEISLTDVVVGPLPAVPLVAGLPDGPVGGPGAALLAVPVLAAAVAGWLLGRRLQRPRTTPAGRVTPEPVRWPVLLGAAAVAGASGGALLGVAAWLSSGPLAGGRLSELGPVPWQTAAFAAAVIAVGAVLGATAARAVGTPRG